MEARDKPSISLGSAFVTPTGSIDARGVAVSSLGDTYVVGSYAGSPESPADFDSAAVHANGADLLTTSSYVEPGSGNTVYTTNAFVAKYNPDGSFAWVRGFGNTDTRSEDGAGVAVDATGNVVVVGNFSGVVPFGSTALTAQGPTDGFVMKLDSAGSVLWANRAGGLDADGLKSVALDSAGSVYATGDSAAAVRKWTAGGAAVWSKSVVGAKPTSVAVDGTGKVVVVGSFTGTVDFNPGSSTYNLSSGGAKKTPATAAFVLKLGTAGDFAWARSFVGTGPASSPGRSEASNVAVDAVGNVYTTGLFYGTVDFNPGSGVSTLSSPRGVFVSKLTADGSFTWARAISGGSGIRPMSLAVDADVNSGFEQSHFRGFARATLEYHGQHFFATNPPVT